RSPRMPSPWPMAASRSESCGNWGQNGTSEENSATDRSAAAGDVNGRLPIPVTAPAGTKGIRGVCDETAVDCAFSVVDRILYRLLTDESRGSRVHGITNLSQLGRSSMLRRWWSRAKSVLPEASWRVVARTRFACHTVSRVAMIAEHVEDGMKRQPVRRACLHIITACVLA